MKKIFKLSYIYLLLVLVFISFVSIKINAIESNDIKKNGETKYTDYKTEINEKSKFLNLFEIESLREDNVKHFKLEDGTYQAVSYSRPVHKLDGDNWIDYDNTLSLNGEYYKTNNNEFMFKQSLNTEKPILHIENNDYSLLLYLQSTQRLNNVNAEVINNSEYYNNKEYKTIDDLVNENKNSSVMYNHITDNMSIEFKLEYDLVCTRLVFDTYNINGSIKFYVEMDNVNLYSNNGNLEFYDEHDNTLIKRLYKPEIANTDSQVSYELFYKVTNNAKNTYCIEISSLDITQSSSSENIRYIPDLDIDDPNKNVYDTYISSTNTNTNYGRSTSLKVSSASTDICLIKSDLPYIPSESTITSSYLNYKYFFNNTSNNYIIIGAYEILDSWDEYTVKWNDNISISSTRQSYIYLYPRTTTIRQTNLSITSVAKSWYDYSKPNNGIALKSIGGSEPSVNIKSYESGLNFQVLVVNYNMNELILEEGTYLIKNVHLGNYLQIDDDDADNDYFSTNATLEMWELDGKNYQKWQFDYLHNGYYMIKSMCSVKVISVSEGNENSSNDALVQKPYTGSYNQQWKITLSVDGNYIIKARSSEVYTTDRVMCINEGIGSNGRIVSQREYDENDYYKDEWILKNDDFSCPTTLFNQKAKMWCWVASAQMLARTNYPSDANAMNNDIIENEQRNAVYYIFGDESSSAETYDWNIDPQNLKNKGGIFTDVAKAAAYFVGQVNGVETFSAYLSPYSESGLLEFLLHGEPVARLYGWGRLCVNFPDSEDELIDILEILDVSLGGHVTVISAAEWSMTDECYIYTVMDPNGVGTKKYLTYNELIFDYTTSGDQFYVRFWFPTVVTKTEFSDKTLLEEILSTDFNSN